MNEQHNLTRWKASGNPEQWVRKHYLKWGHQDWLDLLGSLRRSEFWPMDEASIGAALEAIRDRLLAENSTGEPDGIDEKTTRLDLALELFFERILPSHKVLSEQDVLKSLRDSACSVNPKYVLRTPSLEVLKEAMMKMVTLWDDEYPIYQYEVRNWAICISKLNDVALFGTRGRKPFSDEIRWRVISVWKTRRDYVAWSGFPWP